MPPEVADTAPAEGTDAPVDNAPAGAAVADDAPPEPTEAPEAAVASETAEAAPEAASEAAPEAAVEEAPVEPPAPFDISAWDGAVESLPEHLRESGTMFHGYYQPQVTELAELRQDMERLQGYYNALLSDTDTIDPKTHGEVVTKLEELEAKYEQLFGAHSELTQTHNAYLEQSEQEYVARFHDTFPDFAAGEPKNAERRNKLAAMMEADNWDPFAAAELIQMGDKAIQLAQAAKNEGAPDKIALKMAKMQLEAVAPATKPSSPAAKLVNGAGKTRSSDRRPEAKLPPSQHSEFVDLALERAMRHHNFKFAEG